MNASQTPDTTYKNLKGISLQKVKDYRAKRVVVAWLRLAVFLLTVAVVYFSWGVNFTGVLMALPAGIAAFLFLISTDSNLKATIETANRLADINDDELRILANDYLHREKGAQFQPADHAYANDLDIFGKASIYQYVTRCTAEQSKELLAERLLSKLGKKNILSRQKAVREMTAKVAWRQQFRAYGMQHPVGVQMESQVLEWMKMSAVFNESYWRVLTLVFPIFTLGCAVLFATDVLSWSVFSLIIFACFFIAGSFSKRIHPTYILLSGIVSQIQTLSTQLAHLEKESFSSELIAGIQSNIQNGEQSASGSIRKLGNILNRFDVRLNVFAFFFLNTFLLWDVWQIRYLNQWKQKNQQALEHWFAAIAEMEVLSSLASLSYNQPEWCFPEIADHHFSLKGTAIGHPLIASQKRVDNSFGTNGTGKVALVTGSNMGGKSTFLRSVGVNIVLAMMGAPVCARQFTVSPVKLMSSMRIADNLSENTSTFYAELKKLQAIIEAVNQREEIFILLDEILRGTNSIDRHTGSKALIKQLISQRAVAIIATHDVELAALEQEYPQALTNYHFDVQVDSSDELFFDFKLKDGICKSMNASILMRKIGIEMEREV